MGRVTAQWGRTLLIWRFYRVSRLLFVTIWLLTRERRRVVRARARGQDARPNLDVLRRALRNFRVTAIEMGGLLIKLGQFLSARADLLPTEALAELTQLQDEVPAERFSNIRRIIEQELGASTETLLSSIDPVPAGAASLGQVHRARLKDGRVVALKVQRPNIERIVRADLQAIRFVLELVRRLAPSMDRVMDFRALYGEFSRTVYEELNYEREGRNAERFAQLFEDDPGVRVPSVIWEHTSRRVLALEWIDGIKVTDLAALDAAKVDRDALAQRITGSYIRQMLQFGFFHADPHPGNIFIQPDPSENGGFRIIFLDFGMTGSITMRMKQGLRDAFLGLTTQDASLMVRGMDTLGFLGDGANRPQIEQAVGLMISQFSAMPLGELREMDPSVMLHEVESLLYDQPLRLPAHLAFFGRALAMLVGLATTLSPNFNVLDATLPYAREFLGENALDAIPRLLGARSWSDLGRTLTRDGVAMARSVAAIPQLAERVLERMERGELRMIIESPHLNPELKRRTVPGAAGAALSRPVPAWVPIGLAGVAALAIILWRREASD
jgi:predicted unusual protein kinase regulating ubiquinone biosynthesis (AarF/ABC1/UbiB family)